MSRKKIVIKKNQLLPDEVYHSEIVTKFINNIMSHGKKTTAEKIVYLSLKKAGQELKDEPLKVFMQALDNIKPVVEVKARRVGGATYQVPVEVSDARAVALALSWLKTAAKKRSGHGAVEQYSREIIDAFNGKGGAINMRDTAAKMAAANQAFSHFNKDKDK